MRSPLAGKKKLVFVFLSALLSFLAAALLYHAWGREGGKSVSSAEFDRMSSTVRAARRSITHHLNLFTRSEGEHLFSGTSMEENCIRFRDKVAELYPFLLSIRCYDETLTLCFSAEMPGISIRPALIGKHELIARTGAALREGLYPAAFGPDYRVIVPLISEQQRKGVLEFIFEPQVLLRGIQGIHFGDWTWVKSPRDPVRPLQNAEAPAASCPILFSDEEYRLFLAHPVLSGKNMEFVLFLAVFAVGMLLLFYGGCLLRAKSGLQPQSLDSQRQGAGDKDLHVLFQAVDQSNVAVMVTDVEGCIEYVNQKFLQLTGYEEGELLGQNPRILKSLATPPDVYEELWLHLSRGEAWSGEFYNRKKSGELFWDVSHIAPVRDGSGRVVHYVAVKEDITERKQMEVELIAAKESAENANQAKSDFLANMSHEIRTPMNTIIGMAELTLKTSLSAEQRDYLKSVLLASENLLSIFDAILDISKIEAGTLRLEPIPFSLRERLRGWMSGFIVEAERKKLEILLDVDDDVPDPLIADCVRLGQIFSNLLSNSVKFTESGGVLARVERTGAEKTNEVELHFIVSDTGVGVAEGEKTAIFEKFSQADSSSTRRYGGTGLGLAICSELLYKMKGRIWVDSPSEWAFGGEHGPGSSFHFTIWLGKQYEKSSDFQADFTLEGRFVRAILLLRNQLRLKMVKRWCDNGGLETRVASEYSEACDWFSADPHVLLLMESEYWPDDPAALAAAHPSSRVLLYDPQQSVQCAPSLSGFCRPFGKKPHSAGELLEQIREVQSGDSPALTAASAPALPTIPGKKRSILVAEDNQLNQKLIGRILDKAGYAAHFVDNGLQAVEALRDRSFDLVLMDIQMPEMDGVAATLRLREEGHVLPVIALTAHALKGDREKFLEAGMDDYLCKPVRQDELCGLLENYLSKGEG